MTTPYLEKYDVLETFEKNTNQTILTGVSKENPDEIVVINEFNKISALPSDLEPLIQGSFTNILHHESNDSTFVIVTKYNEGMPLHNFLETYDSTVNARVNFGFEFLKTIVPYDILDNYYKSILIDENQLIVNNDNLVVNELMLLDETLPTDYSFSNISSKIGVILSQIIPANLIPDDDKLSTIPAFIQELNNGDGNYETIAEIYEHYRKLYMYDMYLDDHKEDKATIIPIPVPVPPIDLGKNDSVDTQNLGLPADGPIDSNDKTETISSDSDGVVIPTPGSLPDSEHELDDLFKADDEFEEDHEKRKLSPLALIAFLALLIAGAIYIILPLLSPDNAASKYNAPTANFEITKLDDNSIYCENTSEASEGTTLKNNKWLLKKNDLIILESEDKDIKFELEDGSSYFITLTVTASDEQTHTYSLEYLYNVKPVDDHDDSTKDPIDAATTDDAMDKTEKLNTFDFAYTDNVIEDFEVSRSGSKSLRFDLTDTENGKLVIDNIFMDEKSSISFWLMSDSITPISIIITGYNNDSKIFSKKLTHTPKTINNWELIDVSVNTSLADKLIIEFKSKGTTLWFDDLSIDSYK